MRDHDPRPRTEEEALAEEFEAGEVRTISGILLLVGQESNPLMVARYLETLVARLREQGVELDPQKRKALRRFLIDRGYLPSDTVPDTDVQ